MTNVKLTEGHLSFEFKNVQFAVKYDDWAHFRKQFNKACGGAKAVDFLVSSNDEIWLIEVKDFRQHRRVKPIDLSEEFAQKVRDTMVGLVSAKFLARDAQEADASRRALSCSKLRLAFHLEQPKLPSKLFPLSVNPVDFQLKLKQILRFADPHVKVFDSRSFPAKLGTVVSV